MTLQFIGKDDEMTDATSSETHPCEFVEAEFMFGADLCGFPATSQVDCGYGCMHWICDEHAQAQK